MFSSGKKYFVFAAAFIFVIAAAIILKVVYIETAESSYNAEELPLAAMGLVGEGGSVADVAVTRLYGTHNITTALSFKVFGFNVLGVKAPNIIFFFLSVFFLYLLIKRHLGGCYRWFALMCSALLVFGPPVIQIWGMKNRGGFIENIFALVVCLWICAGVKDRAFTRPEKFAVAIIIGLATWSQPIATVWGACVLSYIFIWSLRHEIFFETTKGILIQASGFVLGVLPLIVLNVLFNFNTWTFMEDGELIGGIDLGYWGRAQQLILDGIPRILGLKEEWNGAWILPKSLALVAYVFFLVPVAWGGYKAIVASVQSRELNIGLLMVVICFAVLAANVMTSWGNFQLEPRRLLLIYIPFAVLVVIGIKWNYKFAIFYFSVWLAFNAWSNSFYVSKHLNGFSAHVYKSMRNVADFLAEEKIHGIYTDVWTGGRITFESKGKLPWFRHPYVRTSYGYVGGSDFKRGNAMVFDKHSPTGVQGREQFMLDLEKSNISCREKEFDAYSIIYKCNRDFRFEDILLAPGRPGDTALEKFAEDMMTQVGRNENGNLIANGSNGFLIYGPYVEMPAGEYKIIIYGNSTKGFVFDVVSDQGEREYFEMEKDHGQGDGILLVQDFHLPHRVRNFEVRIRVAENSDMKISGYKIIYN